MTDLKAINFGVNQFCGPAVLSALTGRNTDECAQVIQSISGAKTIRAVEVGHLLQAFEKLNFRHEKCVVPLTSLYANLTFYAKRPGKYVVLVPHHVVAVEVKDSQVWLIDNHSKEPINAQASARLMQPVSQIYKLTEMAKPVLIRTEIRLEPIAKGYVIYIDDIYVEERHNMTMRAGMITPRSNMEMLAILEKIKEYCS